ncbi:MAG TPA: MarR family transcriptional regulator [Cytophagaceae bacterium]
MRPQAKKTVCFNIKASWHAISRLYNEQAVKYGLTTSVGYVLLNIDSREGTPATKIGPLLGMESRSMTRMLKSMEQDGLIYKVSDANDKRLVKIFLTEKGKEKREIAKKVVKRFNQLVKEELGEEKLETFFEVIEKINSIIARKNIY